MPETLIIFGAKYLIGVVIAIAAVFIISLARDDRGTYVAAAAVAFPLAYLIARTAGLFYEHLPPFAAGGFEPLIPHAVDNAFPSDHAVVAATAAAIVFPANKPLGIFLFLLAALVGTGRVYAGLHYPVDIIGGFAVAVASSLAALLVVSRLCRA